jgi:hypothetical protein
VESEAGAQTNAMIDKREASVLEVVSGELILCDTHHEAKVMLGDEDSEAGARTNAMIDKRKASVLELVSGERILRDTHRKARTALGKEDSQAEPSWSPNQCNDRQEEGQCPRSRERRTDSPRRMPRSEITKQRGQRSKSPNQRDRREGYQRDRREGYQRARSREQNPDSSRPMPQSLGERSPDTQTFTSPQGVDQIAPNKLLLEAATQNETRAQQANIEDENTLGEPKHHCSSGPNCFLPAPVSGPDDTFRPPIWFLQEITVIAATPPPTPTKSSVRFDVSPEAAEHNASLLGEIDYDFQKFFSTQAGSTLDFGSKFWPVEQLRPLLHQHLGFEDLAEVLITGMPHRCSREIAEEERETEVIAMLVRGNHKSAQDEPEIVEKLLSKNVVHGFSMVIPKALVPLIPHAMVQPAVGLAKQWTLDDQGNRVIKCRITQDLSCSEMSKKDFNYSTTRSKKEPQVLINSRMDMEQYPEMVHGWALPRIIHFTVVLRLAWPERTIFIAKYDHSDACRRMAHSALAVVQTITTCLLLAFAHFRMTFGGSPNPPTWCNFSEMVTDLGNEISMCPDWDPTKLRSPNQPETPKPKRLASSIPHTPAREMAVFIPPIESGKAHVFIDDVIDTHFDSAENLARKPHVVPLPMHVTSRPHAGADEPTQRRAILSLPKPLAEGALAEQQIVLGWMLDTRRLTVSLPDDKHLAWVSEIKDFIRHKGGAKEELETLEGQLNHAAYVIPLARHFLTRIRAAKNLRTNKKSWIKSTRLFLADPLLWLELLRRAKIGISMNLIVRTRQPNRICWSDSCPFGLGGFLLRTGRAWRIRMPKESVLCGSSLTNNLLKFIGMAVYWNGSEHLARMPRCRLARLHPGSRGQHFSSGMAA